MSFFRIKINQECQKSISRVSAIKTRNQYLEYLIDPSFQGVNKLFVLSFENNTHQEKL